MILKSPIQLVRAGVLLFVGSISFLQMLQSGSVQSSTTVAAKMGWFYIETANAQGYGYNNTIVATDIPWWIMPIAFIALCAIGTQVRSSKIE